jgi:hypothetical protein
MNKRKPATAVATKRRPTKKLKSAAATPVKIVPVKSMPIYSVHPGISMVQRWIVELKPKTGRSIDEWMKHIRSAGPGDEKQCREWLKSQYGMGTNTAWWMAERAFGKAMGMADDTPEQYLAAAPKYVAQMYAGAREALRALHDRIIELGVTLGDDVRICPCKTIVPLYRKHVFAEIKPASNSRIDLGFALKDEPFTARLIDTGGGLKKNRITHKVAITKLTDIDLQVRRWLKQAYELDA